MIPEEELKQFGIQRGADQEIADRLGLDVEDVTEIRCTAELDLLPADTWIKSANWKRDKARELLANRSKKV